MIFCYKSILRTLDTMQSCQSKRKLSMLREICREREREKSMRSYLGVCQIYLLI